MDSILLQVQSYLDSVNRGEAEMAPHILDEAARSFRKAMDKQFNPKGLRKFTLRMSNIGRPACQLWYEREGTPAEPESYNFPVKMMIGDAVEAIAVAILKQAGVNVTAVNEKAVLDVKLSEGEIAEIYGTSDITIDEGSGERIWDIKSASAYAFREKFDSPWGWENLLKDDAFGYVGQGFGYEEGTGKPFAGWIAVNKESGEFTTLRIPERDRDVPKAEALDKVRKTVVSLQGSGAFPGRCYEPIPETYRKKPTGKHVLGTTCTYCPYKWTCWPSLSLKKQEASTGNNPKLMYYVDAPPDVDTASEGETA